MRGEEARQKERINQSTWKVIFDAELHVAGARIVGIGEDRTNSTTQLNSIVTARRTGTSYSQRQQIETIDYILYIYLYILYIYKSVD